MIRIAIIGLGHIGRIHIAALNSIEGLELTAASDLDNSLAKILPKNTLFCIDYQDLLEKGGFDTVVVATPNDTHNAIAHNVVASGYNVIVEKPAAYNMTDLESLEDLAKQNKQKVYYALHAASAFEVSWLTEHIIENYKRYGPLTAFHSRFFDPYIDETGEIVSHAKSLGDCWLDSGVNALSVIDRVFPVDTLQLESRRQSACTVKKPLLKSVTINYSFPVNKSDFSGLGVIDTAWDQSCNLKCTTFYFGKSGWRITANHSEQTIIAKNPYGEMLELISFTGDRLLNHYLGVFVDYRDRIQEGSSMNTSKARRIHKQFFLSMGIQ
ncbi:MAG: Gfo/Idh/MocA family oxidoreductase [Pseudomonadota bacterium]|nr:Gfo/Idh/MocA family oxidoreductase [Pseudomonadota bacterium]